MVTRVDNLKDCDTMDTPIPDLTTMNKQSLVGILRNKTVAFWNLAVEVARDKDSEWKADLRGVSLENEDLDGIDLEGADLKGANLREVKLMRANLNDTSFRHANLEFAKMQEASLYRSDMRGSCLRHADLGRSTLSSAILQDADLTGATLYITDLSVADLQGAILRDAHLVNANLLGSELSRVTINEETDLRGASIWDADSFAGTIFELDESKFTLTGEYCHAGVIDGDHLIALSMEENPGYIIRYGEWVGTLNRLEYTHIRKRWEAGDPRIKEVKSRIGSIKETIEQWPEVINSDFPIMEKSAPADYLTSESRKTGASPVDIILGDD